ncbi:MAG TPA: DUF438 domain-containing protein [Anaerovoracaceae bacterium]|nr:DUF438 domain-containing protein [Anaerovoracaceae bacterium]
MSELINNREHRQKILKGLINELHEGKSVEEVKARFAKLIEGISPSEISDMEQSLIDEGMPVEEIQRLCDVHASIFEGSIEEIHRAEAEANTLGHPLHTFRQENRAIEELIKDEILPTIKAIRDEYSIENVKQLTFLFEELKQIDKHYSKKENLLFPYMEKYGITAPPKVMWGVDDEIRDEIKMVHALLLAGNKDMDGTLTKAAAISGRIMEMIVKEDSILFPMATDTLSRDEWISIEKASDEIGYCLYKPETRWLPTAANVSLKEKNNAGSIDEGLVYFDAGFMRPEEINAMLNTLPMDITFVDKNGHVKYFSQGKERIFPRPKTIIGREVSNCHPPASAHIVEDIVSDLMSGKKDYEEFWIDLDDKYIYIRYFAVRNSAGEYQGIVEVSQNIKPIQKITGEKRLMK